MGLNIDAIIFDWKGTLNQFGNRGLFDYSEEVLKTLSKKYKLAVISKAVPEEINERLEDVNRMKKYFDLVIVDTKKTSSQFSDCIKKLCVNPEDTLVVDDRMDRGIKIGNELGCKTAWIEEGKYSNIKPDKKTGEPTYKIKSVEGLLTIL